MKEWVSGSTCTRSRMGFGTKSGSKLSCKTAGVPLWRFFVFFFCFFGMGFVAEAM